MSTQVSPTKRKRRARGEKLFTAPERSRSTFGQSLFFMVAVEPVAVLLSRSSVWVAVLAVADDTVAIVSESPFCSRCFPVAVFWVAVWHVHGLIHTRDLIKNVLVNQNPSLNPCNNEYLQLQIWLKRPGLTNILAINFISHDLSRTFTWLFCRDSKMQIKRKDGTAKTDLIGALTSLSIQRR